MGKTAREQVAIKQQRRISRTTTAFARACAAVACLAFAICLVCAIPAGQGETQPADEPTAAQPAQAASQSPSGHAAGQDGADSAVSADVGRAQAADAADEADGANIMEWDNAAPYRADEAIVQLADGVSASELSSQLATFPFVATSSIAPEDVALGWTQLQLAPGTDVKGAISALESSGLVADAQPNFVYHALEGESSNAASQSSLAAGAAALGETLSTASSLDQWHLGAIGAQTAWKTQKTNGAVSVAVLDSGCDMSHPDLKSNVFAPRNVLTGTSNVEDDTGHGTHVCGIVSAKPNNVGTTGVSYNANIIPVKIMAKSTTDTASIVKGYQYVMEKADSYNIRVVNLSVGSVQKGVDAADLAVMSAMDTAYRKDILTVLAAGNDVVKTPYYCFPCDYVESAIGVINVGRSYNDGSGEADSTSNYNVAKEKTKDLSAPGVEIYSTFPDNDYVRMTGTSMAAPVVSGTAALIFAANPALTAGEAKSLLCSTAEDIVRTEDETTTNVGFDSFTGYGLVRADKAVQGAKSSFITGVDSVAKGETTKLTVPQSGTWKWSSDKTSVAKVNATTGVVTGVGHGEASIKATNGTKTLYRTVVVYENSISGPASVTAGSSIRVRASANPVAAWKYYSSDKSIATVGSTSGIVTGKAGGTVTITAKLAACPNVKISKQVKVNKAKNPLAVHGSKKTIAYAKVKAKARTFSKCVVFTGKGKGTITYAKVAGESSKQLSVNKKTGKVTVAKGTKPGTYKIKVRVKAAGNKSYKGAVRNALVKVVVKR